VTPLVDVRDLVVEFDVAARQWRAGGSTLRAVDHVSFTIGRGETLALVGESGCGKTTVGRTLVRIYEPTSGSIGFDGDDIATHRGDALKGFRRRAQLIFQDPYSSLNPRMTIEEIIGEPLRAHHAGPRAVRRARVRELIERVGLPADAGGRFPHAFSGGQRQRVGIARALALAPDLIVADEPVSALDVSIQAQVVNLLKELQEQLGIALLFIAHDLAVVRYVAHHVAVMHLGQIVELGTRDTIFGDPRHPYTQALLSAVPVPDPVVERRRERVVLRGDLPSPVTPPSGCRFHTRCPMVVDRCRTEPPVLRDVASRAVACHFAESTGVGR